MKNNIAINIDHVSKRYFKQGQRTLKELVHDTFVRHHKAGEFIWALDNINLKIKKGDSIGIVGANGSGKSTLLKLIAGVSKPTKGNVSVNGRIAPLIELGAGFHPELTGRENIYLSGAILGMNKKEVDSKYQNIIDFSEISEFIDTPVKFYSSGMYLRLAFAVAVYVDAEILLVDEILAVGDEAFQKKCLDKMQDLKDNGTTIILVSHSRESVRKFCQFGLHLRQGKVVSFGEINKVLEGYE